ncbi:hypothetical protein [Shewanella colwelliana]|uniref:hypothetical protein n=1 Tax=Shewanella colwelliana TaxID=23 RepID=UPI003735F21A
MENTDHKTYPPLTLVKTWIWMLNKDDLPEVQKKGLENLLQTFGSLAKANEYILEHLGGKTDFS